MSTIVIDNYCVKFHPGKFRYQVVPVRPAAYSVLTEQQFAAVQMRCQRVRTEREQELCVDSANEKQCMFALKEAKVKVLITRNRFGQLVVHVQDGKLSQAVKNLAENTQIV